MSDATGIHVVGVHVENVHRLRLAQVELQPGGRVIRVTGKNGAGKSSLLRAVRMAFGGAGEVLPEVLNEDAEDGEAALVRIRLSNEFTVTRRATEANPKGFLRVVGPDGGTHRQGKLNELLGENHDFDVLSFFELKPARQRDILLSLGSDPDLAMKLEIARQAAASIYDERTPVISEQRRCRAIPKPEGERPEPVDTTAETARLGELQAKERRRQDLERVVVAIDEALSDLFTKRLENQQSIDELEEQLATARSEHERLAGEQETLERDRDAAIQAVADSPDVTSDIQEVLERLADASEISKALEPWREWERGRELLEKANERHDELTAQLMTARDEELRLIRDADLPIEGLTFDAETNEPLLNGRPLAVASGAERIRMAVAIAVAADPELRVVLVDEANDLDLDSLEALDELAREHGFQIFCCRIGHEGRGEIVVEDGEAHTEPMLELTS